MNLENILSSYNDLYFFVLDEENQRMVYPDVCSEEGRKTLCMFNILEKKDNSLYFNPYTKQVYEFVETKMEIENKKYKVIRLLEITKYKNLENEYVLDETTGLYLRKKLLKSLNDYLQTAIINKESFSLTMLDIDYFKKINDTYGHQFGDLALNDLAKVLHFKVNENKDKKGILGRYGGEEFIYTINNTDYNYAEERNEYIREFIEYEMEYVSDKKIDLTCSLGSVFVDYNQIKDVDSNCMVDVRSNIDLIIKQADRNLYESKKKGRNVLTMTCYDKQR